MTKFNLKLGKLYISPFILILLVGAHLGNYFFMFTAAYIAALLHETAHIAAAVYFKLKIDYVQILPFGVTAKLKESYIKTPSHEILIAVSGPILNFIISLVCYYLNIFINSQQLEYFMLINLSIGAINLVPCLPLDGGRVLKASLTANWGFVKAFNFTIKLTKFLIAVIILLSVFLLLYCKFNFSLILIGVFLIANITNETKSISLIAMKEVIASKEKLNQYDINHIRSIAVFDTVPARRLLRHFSYNYYYIINIVNKDMEITKLITESQLINALFEKGIRIKMGEI